ncbi:MAG: phosphoglycerate mutase [Myxococcales bacterium]|nr:phosphoglycerate mutase [Myxococcales bacterium]
MAEIVLVRHGQASARARDYDVLSELGARQARRLGEHWARAGVSFDKIFSGPRKRQRDTARHLVEAARAAGARWPDVVELESCDELPLPSILAVWLPTVVESDPVARAVAMQEWTHTNEEIGRLLGRAMKKWAAGEIAADGLLTFAGFVARIEGALTQIRASGAAPLLVTSAGPVATALHLAGHERAMTPPDVMRLAMSIENASVTRVIHDGQRFSVGSAHDVSHLGDDERTLM